MSVVTVVFNCAEPLAETIESIRAQTYRNIEHIVIDGGSTDDTLDVIRRYEDGLALWKSEPDEGIYDAINKGISLATGKYVMLLHAADTYDPDYIERLVEVGEKNDGAIVYCSHKQVDKVVPSGEMSDGIYLHHLHLCHLAMLVPAEVYRRIGPYDAVLRIASDFIWVGAAWTAGVPFVRVEGQGLNFAAGGLSSAQSPDHRALVISEWILAYRLVFPFLAEDAAQSIYLYRFDESEAEKIRAYLASLLDAGPLSERVALFLSSLRIVMKRFWSFRSVDGQRMPGAFAARWGLAEMLGIALEDANLAVEAKPLAPLLETVRAIREAASGRPVTLHYLEVFSQPTETFIPDLISRMRAADGECHVILCDRRVLADIRPYDLLIEFDFPAFPQAVGERALEYVMDTLAPAGFVFHFATNGWRLMSRLPPRFQQIPAIYMTHGIDVFDLQKRSATTSYILDVAAKLPNTQFTAVSTYLRDALVDAGVAFHKVTLVHNVVHERFARLRIPGSAKTAILADSGYHARIVNIGRIIQWKGQVDIVRAISLLKREGVNVHLTLVYGEEAHDIDRLRLAMATEGVTDRVMLRPFVDFEQEPDFLTNFDILVSASKYTSGPGARSETFGMSILEAIAAGLPVVVTDAGGQPEVAGPANAYARIARHGDPASIAEELRFLIENRSLAGDNELFAEERLTRFSAKSQLQMLARIKQDIRRPRMKPLLLSTSLGGGAGGAAQGVHRSLLAAGAQSRIAFRGAAEGWNNIPGAEPVRSAVRMMQDFVHPAGWFLKKNHTIFSVDTDGVPARELEALVEDADIVNLHWYARFLSSENIAWLTHCGKPVVITIRDMHPLTGGCHAFHGCDNWKHDCSPCPQFRPEGIPLPQEQFERKRLGWNFDNISVVTLSEHTRQIVAQSPLFSGCRIRTIPNPVDTTVFRPLPRDETRKLLNLPHDRRIIAYLPSYDSAIKGAVEFQRMLKRLARDVSRDDILVVCAGRTNVAIDAPFEIRQLGHIADKQRLAAFYSAADVTVAPSLEETFSNTAAESIACGTPVAGFATGAIPTLAQAERGRAVPVGDITALANAVRDIIAVSDQCPRLELNAYMLRHHSPETIGAEYARYFSEIIAAPRDRARGPTYPASLVSNTAGAYMAARWSAAERGLQAEISRLKAIANPMPMPAQPVSATRTSDEAGFDAAANLQMPWARSMDLGPLMKTTTQVVRNAKGIVVLPRSEPGHRLFGPNLQMSVGRYTLATSLSVGWKDRLGRGVAGSYAVAEIVWNVDTILATKTFKINSMSRGAFSWQEPFEITWEHVDAIDGGLEVRVWTDGRVAWRVGEILLRAETRQ